MKGEKNKYDKRKLPKKSKFPLRTLDINEEFVGHCKEFFVEYDFFFMLCIITLVQFTVTAILRLLVPSTTPSNIVFYLMLFTIVLALMNLSKNKQLCRCSDQTKVELLVSLKSFFIIFICLSYFESTLFFDTNIEKAHIQVQQKVNDILFLFDGRVTLPYQFTYALIGSLAALITFPFVKLHISYAYYFCMMSRPALSQKISSTIEQNRTQRTIMYLNIVMPLIVCIMFLQPLLESMVVGPFISVSMFKVLRMLVVLVAIGLRMMSFREEVQFEFNESYSLV